PRSVKVRTGHPSQPRFARRDRRSGGKPRAAIGTVDLPGMLVTQVFDDLSEPDENLFAQRIVVHGRRVAQARAKLIKRLAVSPRAVMLWTCHFAQADCHLRVESVAALRTVDRLDVLFAQPFDYFLIALAGPLILASDLSVMEFVAETIFFVAHAPTSGRRSTGALINPTVAGRRFLHDLTGG